MNWHWTCLQNAGRIFASFFFFALSLKTAAAAWNNGRALLPCAAADLAACSDMLGLNVPELWRIDESTWSRTPPSIMQHYSYRVNTPPDVCFVLISCNSCLIHAALQRVLYENVWVKCDEIFFDAEGKVYIKCEVGQTLFTRMLLQNSSFLPLKITLISPSQF